MFILDLDFGFKNNGEPRITSSLENDVSVCSVRQSARTPTRRSTVQDKSSSSGFVTRLLTLMSLFLFKSLTWNLWFQSAVPLIFSSYRGSPSGVPR
ncbi:hypothetical protein RRG08_067068 [Elysia crispata]|uniref:Uncharacterized protein n=1 Tax=Elysia crispata TaxID=231223 RepID=A0AAE1B8L9_9GAST|nr:hypothetical protein RRG08_067068 [Elysia crispata]